MKPGPVSRVCETCRRQRETCICRNLVTVRGTVRKQGKGWLTELVEPKKPKRD